MTISPESPLQAAVCGLLAAATWGGGDFAGGVGAKSLNGSVPGTLRMVIAAHGLSLAVLLGIAAWHGDPFPQSPQQVHAALWALGAGLAGGLSLAAFYISLASGEMGIAASISGLTTAAIPAGVSWATEGYPGPVQIAGLVAAAAAICLIAAPGSSGLPANRRTQGLALFSGAGFGMYFVCLRFANGLGAFEPVALARCASLLTASLLLLIVNRRRSEPATRMNRSVWLAALGIAVFDTAGNLFYLAATRAGRLDIAAVLAALYPVSTIVLAAFWLKERPSRQQWIGIGAALAGVALMAA